MKISEIITDLGKDFKDNFSIENELLFSKYKEVYDILLKSHKGVLLVGSIGCGKTMMMKIMQRLFKDTDHSFRWVTSKDLKDMLDEMKPLDVMIRYGKGLDMDLYIDDIGIYKDKNDYGNVVNIISELIFEREELFFEKGYRTHLSSNLIPSLLEDVLGKRVYDRIVGMCELVSWKTESLRKL